MDRSTPDHRRKLVLGTFVLGTLVLVFLLLAASCQPKGGNPPPPPPGAIPPGESIGGASISGRVVLAGAPPPREAIRITEAGCQHARSEPPLVESVMANPDGTLRNVIVHVRSGLGSRVFAPPGPAELDQLGCVYTPHVIAVQVNQMVTFVNSDPTLHNVHAVTKLNAAFNVGMAVKGQKFSRFFSKPEIVKMKCDVHSWMQSFVGVFDNPYHSVTADGGTFELEGLPAGTYEIEAWHETYGSKSQAVTLAEGENKSIEFRFGG